MFGIMTEKDKESFKYALDLTLQLFSNEEVINVLEIGVCQGETARGIKKYIQPRKINYCGIDSNKDLIVTPPFEGANILIGESSSIFHKLPDIKFHFIFIDGCHCVNHGMLDFLHYSPMLYVDGILVFHDIAPKAQKIDEYQSHGNDPTYIEFGCNIRGAIYKLGLLNNLRKDWRLIKESWDSESDYGGIGIFQKLSEIPSWRL